MIEHPHIFADEVEVPPGVTKKDVFPSALRELFFVEHPEHNKDSPQSKMACETFVSKSRLKPVWVYYSWRGLALRIPDATVYHQLHTARNRNLITQSEQELYRNAFIGVAGLSVGSAALAALVATGGPQHIKIADPDVIEITNLNRIRAGLPDVLENKTEIAAKESWEVDPFLELDLWRDGLRPESIRRFMENPRLDVFIDEMDNIAMKVLARKICKERKIPVVMATDNGDGAILDVERFDEEPERPIFHGRVNIENMDVSNLSRDAFIKMANEIIDAKLFTPRQWSSIKAIGVQISAVPQLGSAAMVAGASAAYAVRQILTKAPMPSGRYAINTELALSERL